MKRKTRRFNEGGDTTKEFQRPIKSTDDAKHETAAAPKTFKAAFAEARANALKGGPKTFEWEGKKYGTALKGETKPAAKPASTASIASYNDDYMTAGPEFKRQGEFPAAKAANIAHRNTGVASEADRAAGVKAPLVTRYEAARKKDAEERKATAAQTRAAGVTDMGTLRKNKMDAYAPVDEQSIYSGFKKGGKVSSASSRADGIAQRGKTRGTMVMCGGGMSKGRR